jgi:hypothetical protein
MRIPGFTEAELNAAAGAVPSGAWPNDQVTAISGS